MIYGSVCSGIEVATLAWGALGWRCAFMSEIDPFARSLLKHRYPDVPLHGDFTTINAGDYEPVDVLVGGTPCQDFSVAGLRAGLAGDRGNLTLKFLRLADRLRPTWIVWENVPGILSINGGRPFGAFLGGLAQLGYGFAYRVLDAQYAGLAQRRERVFVVGNLRDWRRAAAVLFERESLRGDPAPRRQAWQGTPAKSLCGSDGGIDREDRHTLIEAFGVRRLTPTECERLQGVPDGYTLIPYRGAPAKDGPRYRALGNAFPMPVIRWLGERIDLVNSLTKDEP